MAYPASASSGPNGAADFTGVLPYASTLRDGRRVELHRALLPQNAGHRGLVIGDATLSSMNTLLNWEIKAGDTYPFETEMNREQFTAYFFASEVFVLIAVDKELGQQPLEDDGARGTAACQLWQLEDPRLVGCFYVKPNFPGRSSHICNAGFLVAPRYRASGAGRIMAERCRHIAQRLGYIGILFNLVYVTNVASNKLWQPLGFVPLAKVPRAGRLRVKGASHGEEHLVDAQMWYFDLTQPIPALPAPWERRAEAKL